MEENPFKEITKAGYFERAHQRARERAQRQKSPWNRLLVPLVAGSIAAIWFCLYWIVVGAASLVSARPVSEWSEGTFTWVVIPLFLPAIALGMLAGNFFLHLIPPARRALDAEVKDISWASYHSSQRQLLILGCCVTVIFVAISLLVAIFAP